MTDDQEQVDEQVEEQVDEQVDEQSQEILLNPRNSAEMLVRYLELAQQKNAFEQNELVLLNRACLVVLNDNEDPEINLTKGKELLIQGILKGQSKGVFALGDAALLHTIVQYVVATLSEPVNQAIVSGLSPIEETTEVDDE